MHIRHVMVVIAALSASADLATAGAFDVTDPAPYAGITATRITHDSPDVDAVGNAGALVGLDAAVGSLGRVGAAVITSVSMTDGGIARDVAPVTWSTWWVWAGFEYRSPGRVYGKARTGLVRAWLLTYRQGRVVRDGADGGTWALGLGGRIAGSAYLEMEYETLASFDVDGTADDWLRGYHLTLLYRRTGP